MSIQCMCICVPCLSRNICKLAWELWSKMPSLSFNWAMHIKQLETILKLGFIHSQMDFGSAGCLEKSMRNNIVISRHKLTLSRDISAMGLSQ